MLDFGGVGSGVGIGVGSCDGVDEAGTAGICRIRAAAAKSSLLSADDRRSGMEFLRRCFVLLLHHLVVHSLCSADATEVVVVFDAARFTDAAV